MEHCHLPRMRFLQIPLYPIFVIERNIQTNVTSELNLEDTRIEPAYEHPGTDNGFQHSFSAINSNISNSKEEFNNKKQLYATRQKGSELLLRLLFVFFYSDYGNYFGPAHQL